MILKYILIFLIFTKISIGKNISFFDISKYKIPPFYQIKKKFNQRNGIKNLKIPLKLITPIISYNPIQTNLYLGLTFNIVPTIEGIEKDKELKGITMREIVSLYSQTLIDIENIRDSIKRYRDIKVQIKNSENLKGVIELENQKVTIKQNILIKHKEIFNNIYSFLNLAGYRVIGDIKKKFFSFREILKNDFIYR